MEDIKQYIESGILELYVLNDLTPEEKLDVERMAVTYPTIKQELIEISETMELFAEQNAIEPRGDLRESVINQLINDHKIGDDSIRPSNNLSNKKIVPIQPVRQIAFYKYAFAASVALLLVSLIALFNTYNRLQQSQQQLVSLQSQNQKFANQVNFQESQINQYKQQLGEPALQKPAFADTVVIKANEPRQMLALQTELRKSRKKLLALELQNNNHEKELNTFSDPNTRFIKLKGVKDSSSMLITWNPEKKQLWINKKASVLPVNDKGHQYQLWAIRKLKPISLGVFDVRKADSIMERMSSIDRATAFAVTLEPRGGSGKPTLKQMVVMGITHK